MTDELPAAALRRPATTRPRSDSREPQVLPPTDEELAAIERQQPEIAEQAGARVFDDTERGVVWVRASGRGPALNYAACMRWPADSAADRLAALEDHLRSEGEWPVITVAEGVNQPVDLAERLGLAGWVRLAGERIMWTRHPPLVPHLDRGLRMEAVTPAAALECVQIETASFGLPPDGVGERAERLARLVEAGRARAFLLRLVREPVASARLTGGPAVAALSAISVAARHRRRGYGRMIAAVAARAGLATGHTLVWLSVDEANTPAVELYRSLGFEPAFPWSRWAAPAR
jgi:ribosomal protein S18 acetylase RimI-like enzyme